MASDIVPAAERMNARPLLGRHRARLLMALGIGLALASLALARPYPALAQADGTAAGHPGAGHGEHGARKVVAVLYFANHTGVARYDALGKGIAEMLITDLSSLESLRLVERARLEELVAETRFSRSDHADPGTAMELGRMLAAEYVVTGAFTGVDADIRVDGRLIRTETSEILSSTQARGTEDRFFQIHETLAGALIEGLELALSDQEWDRFRETQQRNRIEDTETAVAYSDALDHYDRGQYLEALELMAFVARRAPTSALVGLTYQHMQDAARDRARESARDEAGSLLRRLRRNIPGGN
jgi:TolB-like protein